MINRSIARSLALYLLVVPSLGIAMETATNLLGACSSATVNFIQENSRALITGTAISAATGATLFGLKQLASANNKYSEFVPGLNVGVVTVAMMASLKHCYDTTTPFSKSLTPGTFTLGYLPFLVIPTLWAGFDASSYARSAYDKMMVGALAMSGLHYCAQLTYGS